jgi:hypothetical protein
MRWIIGLLIILVVTTMTIQSSIASDRFLIYVYDKNGSPATDASVNVWTTDNVKIVGGFTDSTGIFTAWLDSSTKYRITARLGGQFGEWENYPPDRLNKIDIHMS